MNKLRRSFSIINHRPKIGKSMQWRKRLLTAAIASASAVAIAGMTPAGADASPLSASAISSLGTTVEVYSPADTTVTVDPVTNEFVFPEVEEVRAANPSGYEAALDVLRGSADVRRVVAKLTGDVDGALELMAAYSPSAQSAQRISDALQGREIIIDESGVPELVTASSSPSGDISVYAMPACGKAWAAAVAWVMANGAICVAFGVAGGVPGMACAVALGLIGVLPNFNNACK